MHLALFHRSSSHASKVRATPIAARGSAAKRLGVTKMQESGDKVVVEGGSAAGSLTLETELTRIGLCARCVLRYAGGGRAQHVEKKDGGEDVLPPPQPSSDGVDASVSAAGGTDDKAVVCPACLGILQVDVVDKREGAEAARGVGPGSADATAGGEESAAEAAGRSSGSGSTLMRAPPGGGGEGEGEGVRVASLSTFVSGMRADGHEPRSFKLELTLPPAVAVRHAAICLHLESALGRDVSERAWGRCVDIKAGAEVQARPRL